MIWGAHEVDGRIAARAAVKLRAALRQSIDAKRLYQLYKESDPLVTDNEAQDNARARAWAMINMLPNNQALINALMFLWAEAFVLGEDSANDAIRQARELKKAPQEGIDWASWKPGDRASALLITPPKAFQSLLSRSGVAIRGLDKTGYDRVGTALARSIRLGLGDTNAAKLINDAIGDPARALTIAITETNRAVSLGAMKTYRQAGLEKMEWAVSDPCPECAQNNGQIVEIGGTFNSGAQQPPAHPNCRCALLPVLPDYETNEAGVVDIAPKPSGREFAGVAESDLLVMAERMETNIKLPREQLVKKGELDLLAAYEAKGYNGLPNVVDADTFETMAKQVTESGNGAVVYRGVAGPNATQLAEQYKYGEHYAGRGIFGNGTYSANREEIALGYAGNVKKGEGAILEMIIPDTSNFIEYRDMRKKAEQISDAVWQYRKTLEMDVRRALRAGNEPLAKELSAKYKALHNVQYAMKDPGQAAVLSGYDGIIVPSAELDFANTNYYVILNRQKMVVKK